MVNAIANHRTAEIHNEVYFKHGHSSNGILNIKEEMTEEDLQGVRRMFQRQASGVRNAHRQLIFAAPKGIEYVPMSAMSNKDMEWNEWMNYLIKLICAVFGINPSEINFDISKDASTTLGDGGTRNEVMLKDTRNSMLRPLLNWVEDVVNDELMPRFNTELADKYIFEFVGLDAMDEDRELDRIKKKVTTVYTVNEIRRELGLDDLDDGDIILDTVYLQAKTGAEAAAMGGGLGGFEVPEEFAPAEDELQTTEEEEAELQSGVEKESKIDFESTFGENKKKAEKALNQAKNKLIKSKPIKVEWFK